MTTEASPLLALRLLGARHPRPSVQRAVLTLLLALFLVLPWLARDEHDLAAIFQATMLLVVAGAVTGSTLRLVRAWEAAALVPGMLVVCARGLGLLLAAVAVPVTIYVAVTGEHGEVPPLLPAFAGFAIHWAMAGTDRRSAALLLVVLPLATFADPVFALVSAALAHPLCGAALLGACVLLHLRVCSAMARALPAQLRAEDQGFLEGAGGAAGTEATAVQRWLTALRLRPMAPAVALRAVFLHSPAQGWLNALVLNVACLAIFAALLLLLDAPVGAAADAHAITVGWLAAISPMGLLVRVRAHADLLWLAGAAEDRRSLARAMLGGALAPAVQIVVVGLLLSLPFGVPLRTGVLCWALGDAAILFTALALTPRVLAAVSWLLPFCVLLPALAWLHTTAMGYFVLHDTPALAQYAAGAAFSVVAFLASRWCIGVGAERALVAPRG